MNGRKLTTLAGIVLGLLLAVGLACIVLPLLIHYVEMMAQDQGKTRPGNEPINTARIGPSSSVHQADPHAQAESSEEETALPVIQTAGSAVPPILPASITGHVYDFDGNGIAGATVRLRVKALRTQGETDKTSYLMDRDIAWHLLSSSITQEEIGNYSAKTGRDGRYTISTIRHFGEALLSASAPGYVVIHSGEYMDLEGANALSSVSEGVEYKKMDFTLFAEAARIRGRVINTSRQGVADARVVVAKQSCWHGSQESYGILSNANGAFEIALPCDNQCVVVAYKTGFAPAYHAEVTPGAGEIELVLREGGAIVGTVRDSNGAPAAGVKIVVTPKGNVESDNPWHAPNPVMVIAQADGSYATRDLSEEFVYNVQVPYPPEEPKGSTGGSLTLPEFIQYMEVITNRMVYSQFYLGAKECLVMAEARDVVVNAGQETRVDLTIEDKSGLPATIHGRITDKETGLPATPFYVLAREPDVDGIGKTLAATVTREDGSYRMLCYGLSGSTPMTVYLEYCAPSNEEAAVLGDIVLGPGEEVEMNFALHALVTAPVRVVSASGTPVQGANVSGVLSGGDGRLTVYGFAPYVTHQLQAYWDEPVLHTSMVAGVSAPFRGNPGETVSEVVITCTLTGSVVGHLVLPEGMTANPTGEFIRCRALCPGIGYHSLGAFLTPDGTVRAPMVPPGVCTLKFLVLPEDEHDEGIYIAVIEDVLIVSGQETDVGIIAPVYEPPEPL